MQRQYNDFYYRLSLLKKRAFVFPEHVEEAVSIMCNELDQGTDIDVAFNKGLQSLALTSLNDSMIGEDQTAAEAIKNISTVPIQNQLKEAFREADGGKYSGYLNVFQPYIDSLDWPAKVAEFGALL